MSRSHTYTEDIGRRLCEALAAKGSLRRVCAEDPELPADTTVRNWLALGKFMLDGEPFLDAYARAKAAGIDALVDESLDIVDQPPPSLENGATDSGHVSWVKERVGYRRWLAERMAPKKYGLKTSQEISGPDGGPVQTAVVIATGVPEPDEEDIA